MGLFIVVFMGLLGICCAINAFYSIKHRYGVRYSMETVGYAFLCFFICAIEIEKLGAA
ncbi:MAG: hypothetical protein MK175_04135 [Pseudoalteromonas sp.]|uniref:hypothetical protein n=1 Tax=Pseudoalteromonas sp. TaxID=53249 RepID=UPI0025D0766A|nr:hypothetical protein [Pseudoalteromonas sp.]MCH2086355.1 hypothetical protein [Pseudoalteromonas sp.]